VLRIIAHKMGSRRFTTNWIFAILCREPYLSAILLPTHNKSYWDPAFTRPFKAGLTADLTRLHSMQFLKRRKVKRHVIIKGKLVVRGYEYVYSITRQGWGYLHYQDLDGSKHKWWLKYFMKDAYPSIKAIYELLSFQGKELPEQFEALIKQIQSLSRPENPTIHKRFRSCTLDHYVEKYVFSDQDSNKAHQGQSYAAASPPSNQLIEYYRKRIRDLEISEQQWVELVNDLQLEISMLTKMLDRAQNSDGILSNP